MDIVVEGAEDFGGNGAAGNGLQAIVGTLISGADVAIKGVLPCVGKVLRLVEVGEGDGVAHRAVVHVAVA